MNRDDPNSGPSPNRILTILTIVYIFNFIDRNVMNCLVEPIKQDLGVSDTMMGVLTGPAFVLFYALAGLPIARWADRGSRVTILALGLSLWSAMTAACGLAQSYVQLALARVGVGIGEASGVPTSQSILTDTFPPEHRYRTLSIYSLGVHFGILFGMVAGGDAAIRSMLVGILGVSVVAALLLWVATRTLRSDLEKTQTWGTLQSNS